MNEIHAIGCSVVVCHEHQTPAWVDPQVFRMANLKPSLIRKEQCKRFERCLIYLFANLFRSHNFVMASIGLILKS